MSESQPVSTVQWKEPPPKRTERYDWAKIAAKVRRKPGQWALVFTQDKTSIATAIKAGNVKALTPSKGFEVRTSNNVRSPERRCDMYLRYMPDNDKEK